MGKKDKSAKKAAAAATAAGVAGAITPEDLRAKKTETFGEELDDDKFNEEYGAVASQTFSVRDAFVPTKTAEDTVKAELLPRLYPETLEMVGNYRSRILGIDFPTVAAALITALAVCRKSGAYETLIMDLTFGVCIGYTISRVAVEDYSALTDVSVIKRFEISEREKSEDPAVAKKAAWVASSNMNASAARLVGYLVIESAPDKGFLADVKKAKGTPFSPVEGGKELEKLIRELGKTLNDSDKAAMAAFKDEFGKLIKYLNHIWGAGGVSVSVATAAAKMIKDPIF